MEFESFAHLARHAAKFTLEADAALSASMRAGAKRLLKATRKTFGEYQDGAGPFGTWPALSPVTKVDRVARGFSANDPLLRSGKLRDSYYTAAQGLDAGVGSDLPEALGQEVGNPLKNLPARSTLGLTFVRAEKEMFELTNTSLAATLLYGRGIARQRVDSRAL